MHKPQTILNHASARANALSGFGGWADEKVEIGREAIHLLSQKKFHPQH